MARDRFADEIRYYLDPDTDQPHFFAHNISVNEVLDVLRKRWRKSVAVGTV